MGSAVLALSDAGATFAFLVLLSQHAMFWFSIAKLNGGRFLDGYRPGFPFHLLYTRPVPTAVSVGAAMAYDAVCSLAFVLQARGPQWEGLQILLAAILSAAPWLFAAAIVVAIADLLWRTSTEQLLTLRHVGGALLISAAFGVAWLTLLRAAGVHVADMPTTHAAWILSPTLLPLMASVLAPWSLSRVRHT